jgi:hypothetical protein
VNDLVTARWQIWVAKQVLRRNLVEGRADPPIIVRDRRAEPGYDWFMAQGATFDTGRLVHHAASGSVFFVTDGPIHFDGLVPGIDPDAVKPDLLD